MRACSAGAFLCTLSKGLTRASPCFATLPSFKQRFSPRWLHEQTGCRHNVRQLMREHIHPKHIIHLMHDENMKISCERSKENYTTGITSILDGRIACNVGGAQHRGLIWKRRGDPARMGLAPEPYRYFAAGAPAHPIILHCSWCVTPAIYPITRAAIYPISSWHSRRQLVHPHEIM